ncbi:hypothetical protein RhiirA4_474974 [Rhizophagus irregularis]|uniref:Uncharacterized protein n=1 Tax=Rhizophagus irregularis TaxID=588596 RepID=A0A2I1H9C6_9GLOM|nr:hypothetical protein RhiirA4_474974 [Rhizophagus irregularis]
MGHVDIDWFPDLYNSDVHAHTILLTSHVNRPALDDITSGSATAGPSSKYYVNHFTSYSIYRERLRAKEKYGSGSFGL